MKKSIQKNNQNPQKSLDDILSNLHDLEAEALKEVVSGLIQKTREETETFYQQLLAEAEERHKAEIQALCEKFALSRQRMYGRKSESHPNSPEVFDEAETAAKDSTAEDDLAGLAPAKETSKGSGDTKTSPKKPRGKRSPLPVHIERVDVLLELPEDQRLCACCNQTMAEIGEEISEQIDVIPMQFRITRFHRKRYACGNREHKPAIAPRPPQVLPKSNATNAFLAMLMTMKYVDGCVLRTIKQQEVQDRCFIKDEGRPLEVGFQEQASNHHKLRELRVPVVSVVGKGGSRFRQVRVMKTSANELLMTCRNVLDDAKTGREPLSRDKDESHLITAHLASGMKAA